jgi:hypothetical protein
MGVHCTLNPIHPMAHAHMHATPAQMEMFTVSDPPSARDD